MTTRYSVKKVKLDKWHPQWPNDVVFKILDSKNGTPYLSKACYTSEAIADEKCADLNKGIGTIT